MMIFSMPTAMAAITADGNKSSGEWNEDWAFGQSGTDPNGPFGDRLKIWQQGVWLEEDPAADAGTGFDENLSTVGPNPSGYDIRRVYAHYDVANDTIYGLTEVYGLPGDLDGDGDPTVDAGHQDSSGDAGPAGYSPEYGVGEFEYIHTKIEQGANSTTVVLANNNWTVTTNCLTYDDIDVKFSADKYNPADPDALPKSVYETAISGIRDCYSLDPGDEFTITIVSGAVGDVDPISGGVLGEDIAIVTFYVPDPDIQIIKYVQGMDGVWYNANTPATGPLMENGSAVSWRYVITNTGDEPLMNVTVTDDQGVTVPGQQDTLGVGETVTYFADGTVSDPCESYRNVGRVDGIGVLTGKPVWDTDPAHYVCEIPVPALTPAGLLGLIGLLGMIGIFGVKRRD